MDRSDEQRIRNNVDGGFRAVLDQIAASLLPPREDVEGKIKVAFEVWQVGRYDLAISLLLDAMIKQCEQQNTGDNYLDSSKHPGYT